MGETLLRLTLALILGGIVGLERETGNRPAGFRTHTLVCVGSALVMITNYYIFQIYSHSASIDPARLGAQVISGIGFLGAGTIIKSGYHVRGLTTAASLWVVACIGLAVGAGFYWAAIAATALIYAILFFLKKVENQLMKHSSQTEIVLDIPDTAEHISKTVAAIEGTGYHIVDLNIKQAKESRAHIEVLIDLPDASVKKTLLEELASADCIIKKIQTVK